MEPITEYPKALYPTADQRSTPVVVHSQAEEEQARAEGAKPLPEWWADGVPDAEPDEFFSRKPKASAPAGELTGQAPKPSRKPKASAPAGELTGQAPKPSRKPKASAPAGE